MMSDPWYSFEGNYKKGIAVGFADIKTDSMAFSFRDEHFDFPWEKVYHLARWNGYWYEVPVKKLRKLAKEKK